MKSKVQSDDYRNFLDDLTGFYQKEEKADAGPLGARLKKIRELQSLSLDQLARMSGLAMDKLNGIEEQKIYPDLGTIIKLAKALRIATGFLLGEESGFSYSVVRKDDRKRIHRHTTGTASRPGYAYQSLATGVKDRHMETFIVTLSGEAQNTELSSHDGEEFLVVMEGAVKIMLGPKEEILNEGDSIYYHSTIPHAVMNNSAKKDAVLLAVLYAG